MKKRSLLLGAKLCLTVILLTWILHRAHLPDLFSTLGGADPWLVLAAFSLHLIGLALSAARWRLLLLPHGIDMRVPVLVRSYLVGMFFNFFLPGSIGGDVIRAYDVKRANHSGTVSASVVLFERLMGIAMMLLMGVAVAFSAPGLPVPTEVKIALSGVLLGLLLCALPVLAFRPEQTARLLTALHVPERAAEKIAVLHRALRHYRGHKSALVWPVVISVLLQVNVGFYYCLLGRALGFSAPDLYYFAAYPAVVTAALVPVTINGIGLNENVWAFLLAAVGIPVGGAVLFAWLHLSIMLVYAVMGGALYALRK